MVIFKFVYFLTNKYIFYKFVILILYKCTDLIPSRKENNRLKCCYIKLIIQENVY